VGRVKKEGGGGGSEVERKDTHKCNEVGERGQKKKGTTKGLIKESGGKRENTEEYKMWPIPYKEKKESNYENAS